MKTYIHVMNENDENFTKQIAGRETIQRAVLSISPTMCPYAKQLKLCVSLKKKTDEDMFPKITRTFAYKEEQYNDLCIHTIAYPDISTAQHYVAKYKSFCTYEEAIGFLVTTITTFWEEENKCNVDEF